MRPYANWFMYTVYKTAMKVKPPLQKEDGQSLEDIMTRILKVRPDGSDHTLGRKVEAKTWGEQIEARAKFWLKRIELLYKLNKLVRIYKIK